MVALLKLLPVKRTQLNSSPLLLRFFSTSPKKTPILGARSTTMRPRGTSVSDEQDVKKVPIRKKRLKILKTAEKRERERKSLFGFVVSSFVRVFSFPFFAFRSSVRSGLSAYLGMNLLFFSQNKSSSTMVRTMLPHNCRVLFSVPSLLCTLSLFCLADYLSFRYSFLSSSVHFMKRNISAFGTLKRIYTQKIRHVVTYNIIQSSLQVFWKGREKRHFLLSEKGLTFPARYARLITLTENEISLRTISKKILATHFIALIIMFWYSI